MAFAGVAVLLALVGLHSLLAYVVAARTQEIGVRMALGASRAGVLALVWMRAARLTLAGAGAGLALAFAASRSVQALLAGIQRRRRLDVCGRGRRCRGAGPGGQRGAGMAGVARRSPAIAMRAE